MTWKQQTGRQKHIKEGRKWTVERQQTKQSKDVVWEKLEGAPEGGKGMAARCLEGGGWRGHQKDCPGARTLGLIVTFPWSSGSLASSPWSFFVLYEPWSITSRHRCEVGAVVWTRGEEYWTAA